MSDPLVERVPGMRHAILQLPHQLHCSLGEWWWLHRCLRRKTLTSKRLHDGKGATCTALHSATTQRLVWTAAMKYYAYISYMSLNPYSFCMINLNIIDFLICIENILYICYSKNVKNWMTFCYFLPPCFEFLCMMLKALTSWRNWTRNTLVHVLCCFSAFISCFHLWKGRSLQIEGLKGQTVNIHQRTDRK